MRSSRIRSSIACGLLTACVLLTGGASVAQAQGKPAAGQKKPAGALTDAQKKAEAKRLFGDANNSYESGRYEEAYRGFSEADALVPGAVPKYRAAEAIDKAGKTQEAITAYEAFLASNPPADKNQERIDTAKKRLEALKGAPAEILVKISPAEAAGATILVDGAQQTGTTLKIPPGKHVITVKAPGFEDATVEATFTFGEKREIPVEMKKGTAAVPPPVAPPPPATQPTEPPPKEEEGETSKIPAYITLGLAGAGLVVGTIFGISALSSQSDYEENPTQDSFDSTERNALIADMAFGASIAFGVTGVVLLVTASDDGGEAAMDPRLKAQQRAAALKKRDFIAPYVTPTGGGAAARMSF